MRQLDPLGIAGRARRVDDRAEVVRLDSCQSAADLDGLGRPPPHPLGHLLAHKPDPFQRELCGRIWAGGDGVRGPRVLDDLAGGLGGGARVDRHGDGAGGLDPEVAPQPREAVLADQDHAVALLDAGFDEPGRDGEDVPTHCVPALDLPLLPDPMMDERAVPVLLGLAEEDTERGPRVDGFGVDSLDGAGGGGYLTALMVSVSIPEGTETVTLSPFLWPTSARPTGESTEIRPADGSLSTAPTR